MKKDFLYPYEKKSAEQEVIKIEWGPRADDLVVAGYVLNTVTVKVKDTAGTDVSASMLVGNPLLDTVNNFIYLTFKGGTSGTYYWAPIICTFYKAGSTDQIQEAYLQIIVEDR